MTTTIVIADDHSDIRRLLILTLGKEFTIVEADDGISALEAIRHHHPRAVLLDVMMPGEMDGLQVLDAIKADPSTRDTVVAMVTARGQQSDSDAAKLRGADAYFIKPFSPLQVVGWVRERRARRSAQSARAEGRQAQRQARASRRRSIWGCMFTSAGMHIGAAMASSWRSSPRSRRRWGWAWATLGPGCPQALYLNDPDRCNHNT